MDGPLLKGTPYAVDAGEDGEPTSKLTVIGEFEVAARPGIARNRTLKPIRTAYNGPLAVTMPPPVDQLPLFVRVGANLPPAVQAKLLP